MAALLFPRVVGASTGRRRAGQLIPEGRQSAETCAPAGASCADSISLRIRRGVRCRFAVMGKATGMGLAWLISPMRSAVTRGEALNQAIRYVDPFEITNADQAPQVTFAAGGDGRGRVGARVLMQDEGRFIGVIFGAPAVSSPNSSGGPGGMGAST